MQRTQMKQKKAVPCRNQLCRTPLVIKLIFNQEINVGDHLSWDRVRLIDGDVTKHWRGELSSRTCDPPEA